jgi:EPS-associated MarR family transcriptional regulator
LITEYSRLQILRAIKDDTSQPKIAKEVGYSIGKVNFILKELVKKGLIKMENFANSNSKSKYRYLLTKNGLKEKIDLTKKFIEIKKVEYEQLQRELEIIENKKLGI